MNIPIATLSLFARALLAGDLTAQHLDPTNPKDALAIARKIQCSTLDIMY